jgi:5'-nucleotidase
LDKPSCAADKMYAGKPVQRDPRVLAAIAGDLKRAKAERDKPIGLTVTAAVNRAGPVESALNNLVTDIMREATPGADAAFCNAGAIRIPLPAGPLSYGTVFEMFPFDNAFATLKLSGRQLANLVAHNLSMSNGILGISGFTAAASCEKGKLQVTLYDPQNQPIAPERELTVTTSDFLASAGDGVLTGQGIDPTEISIRRDHLIRDALLEALTNWPNHQLDGSDKRFYDPEHPRIRYPGKRPVLCE